ncbi:MAG TPA: ATP-binding protein, partial [Puia sp.]|nr:ATP-binding protein [Puia sp.]
NIVLLCKEILNNSLRHARCSKVIFKIVMEESAGIIISIEDNGQGFEQDRIKKGNGFNNIQRRADRMDSVVEINAGKGSGTKIILRINLLKSTDKLFYDKIPT